jgi:hypothetical protein
MSSLYPEVFLYRKFKVFVNGLSFLISFYFYLEVSLLFLTEAKRRSGLQDTLAFSVLSRALTLGKLLRKVDSNSKGFLVELQIIERD